MSKKAAREERAERRAQKWKEWKRGERGLCGRYFTRKFTAWFFFAVCVAYVSSYCRTWQCSDIMQNRHRACLYDSSGTRLPDQPGRAARAGDGRAAAHGVRRVPRGLRVRPPRQPAQPPGRGRARAAGGDPVRAVAGAAARLPVVAEREQCVRGERGHAPAAHPPGREADGHDERDAGREREPPAERGQLPVPGPRVRQHVHSPVQPPR